MAAFMSVALAKGIRSGCLDRGYEDAAERAWAAMHDRLAPDGTYPVSAATPPGTVREYDDLPLGLYPWGQGAVLRALHERAISLGMNGGGR